MCTCFAGLWLNHKGSACAGLSVMPALRKCLISGDTEEPSPAPQGLRQTPRSKGPPAHLLSLSLVLGSTLEPDSAETLLLMGTDPWCQAALVFISSFLEPFFLWPCPSSRLPRAHDNPGVFDNSAPCLLSSSLSCLSDSFISRPVAPVATFGQAPVCSLLFLALT